jgi:hypothetical protein
VAACKGAGLAGAATPNEAQKSDALGTRSSSKPTPNPKQAQPRLRRSGRDNPARGGPRHGYVGSSPKPTTATKYAVYSGRDRLGSYGQAGDAWVAFTRRGLEIGTFASQSEAADAIEREASRP